MAIEKHQVVALDKMNTHFTQKKEKSNSIFHSSINVVK